MSNPFYPKSIYRMRLERIERIRERRIAVIEAVAVVLTFAIFTIGYVVLNYAPAPTASAKRVFMVR